MISKIFGQSNYEKLSSLFRSSQRSVNLRIFQRDIHISPMNAAESARQKKRIAEAFAEITI